MRMSPLVSAVDRALAGRGGGVPARTLVVALSGGADSVALLDALVALRERRGLRLVAAHLDHGLRPDSGEDAAFCRQLCARLEVPLRVGSADVRARARQDGGGIEEAARRERYAFLRRIRKEEEADAIVTAHNRDDQAETLLLRLLRGSGRAGLAAMRPRSRGIVRPLLQVSRAEVLRHLEERSLSWREDATNADRTLVRNRVRHELLPYLESRFNPRAKEVLARTAGILADEARLLERKARSLLVRAGRRDGDALLLSRNRLASAPRAVARLALRAAFAETGGLRGVRARHVERLLDLLRSRPASGRALALPGGRVATVRFDELWVGPRTEPKAPFAYPLRVPGRVQLPGGLAVEAEPASETPGAGERLRVAVPSDAFLELRTRRPGDRVWRRGREVSLKRFLMERRIPAEERGALPLLAAGPRVLWFPGTTLEGRTGDRWIGLRLAPSEKTPGAGR